MRKLTYLAIFEPTKTGYSAFFPDLPGCITVGKDFEDARSMAQEALELHVTSILEDGDVLPTALKCPLDEYSLTDGYKISPITIFKDF